MATIAQLAPTLISVGFTAKELRRELRPKNAPPPPQSAPIQRKRYEQIVRLLCKNPTLTDEEIARRVTTVPASLVTTIRAEVNGVVAQLAGLDPVDEGVDPETELQDATVNASTNRVIRNKHGLEDGTQIQLVEVVGTSGVSQGEMVFVINTNANNFQVSRTQGGSEIDFVGAGSIRYLVMT